MKTCALTLALVSIGVSLLAGCTSASITWVGTDTFPPLPDAAEMLVFSNEQEIQTAYMTLGIITHSAEGMTSTTLEAGMAPLKSKAREVGANGVIIDQTLPMGAYGRGLMVRTRAMRMPGLVGPVSAPNDGLCACGAYPRQTDANAMTWDMRNSTCLSLGSLTRTRPWWQYAHTKQWRQRMRLPDAIS
jgi:hypothetical protein